MSKFLDDIGVNKVWSKSKAKFVHKVNGKDLSTNDFTDELKAKLESLNNYNDTELRNSINTLTTNFNTLLESNPTQAIENFNEIIAFLSNIEDSETLDGIIAGIETHIASINNSLNNKVDKIEGKGLSTNDYDDTAKGNVDLLPEVVSEISRIVGLEKKKLTLLMSNTILFEDGDLIGVSEPNMLQSISLINVLINNYNVNLTSNQGVITKEFKIIIQEIEFGESSYLLKLVLSTESGFNIIFKYDIDKTIDIESTEGKIEALNIIKNLLEVGMLIPFFGFPNEIIQNTTEFNIYY